MWLRLSPVHTGRTAVAHDQSERVLQQVATCQFSVEAPEPVVRFGLGLAIERVLELPELFWGCYLLRAITRSFSPRRRVRTSSVPSRRTQIGPGLRVHRPEVEPVVRLLATTNASDCGADTRRLTGRTGLRGGLSLGFLSLIGSALPALSVVALPDVPATPTPPEMTAADDYPRCQHRPSSLHQGLGDSGCMS